MNWDEMTEKERNSYINQDFVSGYYFIPGKYSLINMDFISDEIAPDNVLEWWKELEVDDLFWEGTTPRQKEAMSLYFGGMTQRSAGSIMGITKQSVSRLLTRGIRNIRKGHKVLKKENNS